MTRSWNENWSLRRVPRPDRDGGVKKPSRAKPRTCATVNPSSLATSREVYPFIPYRLLAPGTSHFAFGDGSRFRRLALDPLRRFPLASRPFRLEARLERCHQVDDLRLRRLGRLLGDLLALDLALNLLEHLFAYVVLVLVGYEGFRRRLLHQLHGELQLRFLDLDLRDRHVGDRADFVGVAQLLHDEPVRLGTHRDEVLLAARRVLPHRHALRLLEGLRQQPIGAVPALVGAEEVRFLDDLPVHLLLGHELRDLDRVGGLLFEGLQLLRGEYHVLPLRELVALHHLVLLDLVAVLGADVLLLQTRAVLLVQPIEADRGRRLAGGEHLDRHGNEAEGQGGGTKRVCAHGLRFHPNACKTEARARSPQYLPRQAVVGPHAGAGRPSGDRGPSPSAGGLFVVHMHAARRLHWDLRLELDGVLRSWAVPKGPSPNRADKRLAVHVEDHPLEYGEFEGIIPEGNYGAGGVIVWDRGRWVPLEDPEEGMQKGKLLFELHGYKLKGKWTLVKLKKGEKEWLLIKEKDGYAATDGALPPESVLSGLTVEELKAGKDRAAPLEKELTRLKAPRRAVAVEEAEPMLAETREQPFSKPGWLFELKLDGYRVRAARQAGEARLVTRNGHDIAPAFPEIARALAALPYEGLIVDGELVVPDEAGRPSFQRLQNRAKVSRALDVRRGAVESPAVLYVFDVLAFGGYDLRPLPLERRKPLLEQIVPRVGPIKYLSHFEKDGEALYEQVVKLGLEGVVAKKADSPYRAGRSPNWLKIRADRTDDFVVVRFTRPKGSRSGFGALDLGAYENGKLVYAGRVGSGFTAAQLKEVSAALERGVRPTPAFTGPVPPDPGHTWVSPTLGVAVRY